MKKCLIVYYSRTGTAKKTAANLHRLLGGSADIEEIIDLKNRRGILGALVSAKDCFVNNITKIGNIKNAPSKYSKVIIITPIWGGKPADAIRTYIAAYKSDLGRFALVTCSDNTSGESVQKDIMRMFSIKPKTLVSIKKREAASMDVLEKSLTPIVAFVNEA